jgi:hypothetical protein
MVKAGQVLWSDDGLALAELGTLTVYLMAQPLTMERLGPMRRQGEQQHARFGTHCAALTIAENSAITDMPRAVRHEAAKIVRDLATDVSATVLEGSGFKAIAGRAIITGVRMLSGKSANVKIFADVDSALEWLVPRVPAPDGVERVEAAAAAGLITRARAAIQRNAR